MVKEYDETAIPAVYDPADVPAFRDEEGLTQVVFRGLDVMLGYTVLSSEKPDSEPHSHPWEQVNMLLEGSLDMVVDGEVRTLEPHDTLLVPPGVEHTSRTRDETAVLLAVWPLREDRLSGTEYQLEFDT